MANRVKGEVRFEVGTEAYTFVLNNNAFCELESLMDRSYSDIAQEMQAWAPSLGADKMPVKETEAQMLARSKKIRFATVRAVFWAGLQEHHSDVTLRKAGALVDDLGGAAAGMNVILQSLIASMPDAEEKGKSQNPPKPSKAKPVQATPAESTGSAN